MRLSQNLPSISEYAPFPNIYMRPSQNLPLRPRIYPFEHLRFICDPTRIYPSFSEYTPPPFKHLYATIPKSAHPSQNRYHLFDNYIRQSHYLPLPPRIYPVLYKVTLLESASSFQNIPTLSTTICDAPRIYPTLQESTLPSQNIGLAPPLRYATLPESTHPSSIYCQVKTNPKI